MSAGKSLISQKSKAETAARDLITDLRLEETVGRDVLTNKRLLEIIGTGLLTGRIEPTSADIIREILTLKRGRQRI